MCIMQRTESEFFVAYTATPLASQSQVFLSFGLYFLFVGSTVCYRSSKFAFGVHLKMLSSFFCYRLPFIIESLDNGTKSLLSCLLIFIHLNKLETCFLQESRAHPAFRWDPGASSSSRRYIHQRIYVLETTSFRSLLRAVFYFVDSIT